MAESPPVAPNRTQSTVQQRILKLEGSAFGKPSAGQTITGRISALERELLGQEYPNDALPARLQRLEAAYGTSAKTPAIKQSHEAPKPGVIAPALGEIQSAKTDFRLVLAEAVNAYDKRQIEKARDLFEKVLQLDPNNTDAAFSLGCLAEDRGDLESARRFYEKASATKPGDAEIATAVKNINAKIKQQPPKENIADNVSKASAEFRAGHYSAAKSALEKILASAPTNDRAHFALAECYRHLQDESSAIAHFKEAVRLKPDNQIYKSELARMTSSKNDSDRFPSRRPGEIVPMDAVPAAIPKRIDSVSWAARNLIAEARVAIEQLIQAEKSGDGASMQFAESNLAAIRKQAPDPHAELIDQIDSYHKRGNRESKQGLLGDALADYRKAFSLNPWDPDETLDLVRLEIQNQDWSMAQQHCMAAIACKPTSTINWLDLGLILLHKRETEKAEACFSIAARQDAELACTFLRQATISTPEQEQKIALDKALARAQLSKRMNSIGMKRVADDNVPDPLLAAYKSKMLLKLADAWDSDRTGTIVVATIDKAGKVVRVELLRSSGDADVDARAQAAIKTVQLDHLPAWYQAESHDFVVNFDKVRTLAQTK